jgi:hypothetical protein
VGGQNLGGNTSKNDAFSVSKESVGAFDHVLAHIYLPYFYVKKFKHCIGRKASETATVPTVVISIFGC